jgi:predicted transcriptional regulator
MSFLLYAVSILTPPQFKILAYAWNNPSFTVSEINESGVCGDVSQDTIRTTVKRVTDKGFLEESKEKGSPVMYRAKISKQDYYIQLAKTIFGTSSEEDRAFFKWAMDQV